MANAPKPRGRPRTKSANHDVEDPPVPKDKRVKAVTGDLPTISAGSDEQPPAPISCLSTPQLMNHERWLSRMPSAQAALIDARPPSLRYCASTSGSASIGAGPEQSCTLSSCFEASQKSVKLTSPIASPSSMGTSCEAGTSVSPTHASLSSRHDSDSPSDELSSAAQHATLLEASVQGWDPALDTVLDELFGGSSWVQDGLLEGVVSSVDGSVCPYEEGAEAEEATQHQPGLGPTVSIPTFPPSPPITGSQGSSSHAGHDSHHQSGGEVAHSAMSDVEAGTAGVGEAAETHSVYHRLLCYQASAAFYAFELLAFAFHLLAIPCLADALGRASASVTACTASTAIDSPAATDSCQLDGLGYSQHPPSASSSTIHQELSRHRFTMSKKPLTYIAGIAAFHFSMLSLAMIFDWSWYPVSTGGVSLDLPHALQWHIVCHSRSLLTLGGFCYMLSRYCHAANYERMLFVYAFTVITLCECNQLRFTLPYSLARIGEPSLLLLAQTHFHSHPPRYDGTHAHHACRTTFCTATRRAVRVSIMDTRRNMTRACGELISPEQQLRVLAAAGEQLLPVVLTSLRFATCKSSLYGLVLKQVPHPSTSYTLGMAPALELWARLVINRALENLSSSDLFAALLTIVSPMPPIHTIALAVYLTYLRYWMDSLYLGWHFDGGLHPSCCSLSRPLPFYSGPFLVLLFLFTIYRQWCAIQLWNMRQLELCLIKRQKDLSLLRIEQLHRFATPRL